MSNPSDSLQHLNKLLAVKQVAEILGLSSSKVYELIAARKIGCYRIEGAIRVSECQILEYLNNCRQDIGRAKQPPPVVIKQTLKNLSLD